MQGYIQLYTGNGKGKSTAAFGLALRAAGAGKRVYIAQFVKGKSYSEISAIDEYLPSITIKQFGRGCFIKGLPVQDDIDAARAGLKEVESIIVEAEHDIVILDEACIALYYNLFTTGELISILEKKPFEMEIVITGRYAPPQLIEIAHLVTEMREVKHYYNNGVEAREGIEF